MSGDDAATAYLVAPRREISEDVLARVVRIDIDEVQRSIGDADHGFERCHAHQFAVERAETFSRFGICRSEAHDVIFLLVIVRAIRPWIDAEQVNTWHRFANRFRELPRP